MPWAAEIVTYLVKDRRRKWKRGLKPADGSSSGVEKASANLVGQNNKRADIRRGVA
jgi:hypothetical protein